jgi:sugar lactone lactonase YvrE
VSYPASGFCTVAASCNLVQYNPYGVAVDSSGNYYIAGWNQNRVFKVNTSGLDFTSSRTMEL